MDTELINKMADIITEKELLIEELMIENKQYRDVLDRLNDYIRSYEVEIHRFNESNKGD